MTDSPRFGRIPDAKRRTGLSKVELYEIAAANPGLFKKAGAATIVDLRKLDQVIADLPEAEITTGLTSQSKKQPAKTLQAGRAAARRRVAS
jgi:hypothetical protein